MRMFRSAIGLLRALARDHRGATAIEYGLILALVFLAMVTALRGFAGTAIDMWTYVAKEVLEKSSKAADQ